jgi:thymidylate kinase
MKSLLRPLESAVHPSGGASTDASAPALGTITRADRPALTVVAVTGCDGSGKSTLAARLVEHLRREGAVEAVYLGQSSGNIAAWIKGLPGIGALVHRYLIRKSDRVHDRPSAAPGNVAALVIYLLSRWRAHKFRRMLSLCRRGITVVADRYPQATTPGFLFDGPQLAKSAGGNAWVRLLRTREQRLYERMAASVPMLLIRLNIDAETAHARKPDHALERLREKTDAWPRLRFNAARILELDARQDAASILDASLHATRLALRGVYA